MKRALIVILLVLLSACSFSNKEYKKEKNFLGVIADEDNNMVMLLNTEVYLTTVDPDLKEEMNDSATNILTKYHKLLDSHAYYLDENDNRITNLRVLNENINNGPIKVEKELIEALKEAINLTKLTKGFFNPTMGYVVDLYSDKFLPFDSDNSDPDKQTLLSEINNILNYETIDEYIIVDSVNSTVELKQLNGLYKIDLGAFSKGYILDKVYEELVKYDSSFMLDAGASSIITYTNEKENINWNIACKDPEISSEVLIAFHADNTSVSTSGDYEKYYFNEDGIRRHHILNPYTGLSENYYRSLTLTSDTNAGVIDALTTALFNVENINEIKEIISNVEKYYNMDINYAFVDKDYDIVLNSSFKNSLIKEYTSMKANLIED